MALQANERVRGRVRKRDREWWERGGGERGTWQRVAKVGHVQDKVTKIYEAFS